MKTETKLLQHKNNKISKKNNLYNNIYKWFLYIITILMALIILASIFAVIKGGVDMIRDNDVPLSDWLLTNIYSPTGGLICGAAMIINTIWMSFLAVLLSAPIAIGTALIITRTLKERSAALVYSVVAILAAVPSVIYGALGYYVIDKVGYGFFGYDRGSLFTIVIMVSFMITPTITIMTVASIRLTDTKMEDSSYALGASKTQTSFYITLRAAKTGIYTGILFAVGRCIAETTAISMVGSPLNSNHGLTLVWWKQSLFMGPAILTANTSEIVPKFAVVPIISMLMIITTLSVFAIMKLVEYKSDENNIIRKQTKEYTSEVKAKEKYEKYGISKMSSQEQDILIQLENKKNSSDRVNMQYQRPEIALQSVLTNSTVSTTKRFEDYKNNKSMLHNGIIYTSAAIGILLLASIMLYLLIGGFEWLNWDYLTIRGQTVRKIDGHRYYVIGLAVPIIGTYLSMILSVLVAMPLGVMLGICLSTYLSKERKLGWAASYLFQALTAVPGVIWATFATSVLMTTGLYKEHIGFVPIIFMIFIILPSVIKSVEEAGGRVKKNLKEGSYALGATTATSTRKIYIREVFPSIVSGTLLAMSIAMAESTIFIYIISVHSTPIDVDSWLNDGGYTLATLIFTLNQRSIVVYPESAHQIKTVGIILMIIILSISYTSTLVNKRKFFEASFMGLAILLFPLSVYINHGSIILLILTILCLLFALFIAPLLVSWKSNRNDDIVKSRGLKYGK